MKTQTLLSMPLLALGLMGCAGTSFSELPSEAPRFAQTQTNGDSCNEGATWEERNGEIEVPKVQCASGDDLYENITTYRCENGAPEAIGHRPGSRLRAGLGINCTGTTSPGTTPPVTEEPVPSPTPVTKLNCGQVAHGGTTWRVLGQTQVAAAVCQDGSQNYDTYALETQFICQNGELVGTGNSRRGALVQAAAACVNTRPIYCTDYYANEFCLAYQYLFGRWPDRAGVEYWAKDLPNRGVPLKCWVKEISNGTRNEDCERHKNIHGGYPTSPLCPQTPIRESYLARQSGC
ncbi:MAG: hypothetical protein KF767_13110 [Bdellovibrionaceae bacterium]|nr:hypothetical protein [Pseudobdellovibrionaceae bacterium]